MLGLSAGVSVFPAFAQDKARSIVQPGTAERSAVIDISTLFGNRVTARAKVSQPFPTVDFEGNGAMDSIYPVRILPSSKDLSIASDVTVLNLWDKTAVDSQGEELALAIISGKSQHKYLFHSSSFFGSPIWQERDLPLSIHKKGSKQFREFHQQSKAIANDILVLGTESGIDIALYWNGKQFKLFWPKEEP